MFAGERRDRGGTRGGQSEFKWSDVKDDKHRENYLGHSLNAPVGRWQNKRDLQWFNRDKSGEDASVGKEELKRRQEMTLIKQQEQEAMSLMLRGEQVPNRVSLSTKELSSLLKKGHDDDDSLAAERIKGVGFHGGNANLVAVNAEAAQERLEGVGEDVANGSESRATATNTEPSKQQRKEMKREAKAAKKLAKALRKEKKRSKRSKHNKSDSDDSDSEKEWTERKIASHEGAVQKERERPNLLQNRDDEKVTETNKDSGSKRDAAEESRHGDNGVRGSKRRGRSRSRSGSRDRRRTHQKDHNSHHRQHRREEVGSRSRSRSRSKSRSKSRSRSRSKSRSSRSDRDRDRNHRHGERESHRHRERSGERRDTHRHPHSHRRHRSRIRSRGRRSRSRERRHR